jgi:hypothetical protein
VVWSPCSRFVAEVTPDWSYFTVVAPRSGLQHRLEALIRRGRSTPARLPPFVCVVVCCWQPDSLPDVSRRTSVLRSVDRGEPRGRGAPALWGMAAGWSPFLRRERTYWADRIGLGCVSVVDRLALGARCQRLGGWLLPMTSDGSHVEGTQSSPEPGQR